MRKNLKKQLLKNWLWIVLGFGVFMAGIIIVWVSMLKLPDFRLFTERKIQSSTKIYDRTGEIVLYDVHQDIKRTVVPYEEMGINIKNATVAIEDSEFYNHQGIRLKSIIRAVWSNISGGKTQGGSTITQQLIKNTLLTSERSVTRKVKEWILAVKLEKIMNKEEILSLYLNEAPYGGNIYGIQEASKAFFNKDAKDLTMAESAYLAAIPNGPTYYSPYRKNKDKLDERKNLVLNRMLELKFITAEEHAAAKAEVVVFQPEKPMNIAAPHFVFFVKEYLENKYGIETLEGGGLKVITTIDYDLQKKAEEITLKNALANEKNWNGSNAAAVAIDPKTGQILAMVGSRNYFDKTIDGNYNVTTAERQPGSSFKPIVYALALKKGYTENTTLFDVKTEFNASCDPTGVPLPGSPNATCYNPDNYDAGFRGPMTLRNGLAQSINIIAVKLLYLVGITDSIKMAHDLGVSTLNDPTRYGLSLVIGGGETSLLDMTSVYSVFANNGTRNPYQSILSVTDDKGNVLEKFESKSYEVLNPNVTRTLSSILSDNQARTPTFGSNSILNIPNHEVAVKTGTTNNNKDAWTIGYTPSIAVGVWVGNNDNTPMKKGGAALAGPIWNEITTSAINILKLPNESFDKPDPVDPSIPAILRGFWQGGETFTIDSISNKLATEYTPENTKKETSITNVHTILYWIEKNNPLISSPGIGMGDSQYKNWEYGVQKWWQSNQNKYQTITNNNIPSGYDEVHTADSKPSFEIFGIENGVYSKDKNLNITINPISKSPIQKIDVFINNNYITSLKSAPFSFSLNINDLATILDVNTIRIIGIDSVGNIGEKTETFQINN